MSAIRPAAPRAELRALVDVLRRMPDSHRSFSMPADVALRDFQTDEALLASLRESGMPARRGQAGWLYDPTDLLNVALHVDIGSRHRKVLAWWARELGRPYGDAVCYRVDYVVRCPDRHAGACEWNLLTPGGRVEVRQDDPAPASVWSVRFDQRRRWPALPDAVRDLLDLVADVRFVRLPDPLRWDTEFIRTVGIGDCSGVAKLLVAEAAARGLPARMSYGRSLTPPFSAAHYWAELLIEDVWVPLDPVLLKALLKWELLDAAIWDQYASIGAILGRLGEHQTPMGRHGGRATDVQLQVSLVRC